MTTHAVDTLEEAGGGSSALALLRHLDLVVLALALPVFLLAGWPLLGFAATASAWLLQRGIQAIMTRRAAAAGDRRAAIGVLAASLMGRLWLVALSVLGAGLVEREAGLAAGVFAATLFTVFFCTLLIVKPLEESRR